MSGAFLRPTINSVFYKSSCIYNRYSVIDLNLPPIQIYVLCLSLIKIIAESKNWDSFSNNLIPDKIWSTKHWNRQRLINVHPFQTDCPRCAHCTTQTVISTAQPQPKIFQLDNTIQNYIQNEVTVWTNGNPLWHHMAMGYTDLKHRIICIFMYRFVRKYTCNSHSFLLLDCM